MDTDNAPVVLVEHFIITSSFLKRDVELDIYYPPGFDNTADVSLLLINDGQDLRKMVFENILDDLYAGDTLLPLLCVGIHCSGDRRNEYGTAQILDYKGRGTTALAYQNFVFGELLPFVRKASNKASFKDKSFCGFSLGGLSAMDIVWNHANEFYRVGVFSGSFWWRTVGQHDILFDEDLHRVMHMQVRKGTYKPWLKFFFETGTLDETADRNNNGVIDAIDDTISLIYELQMKGYDRENDIKYVELADGRHDVPTWAKAFPAFLIWGWGQNNFIPDNN
ncbi:MAG: alpha/beta hydrolase-fold protein [Ginsengibacter sp.]